MDRVSGLRGSGTAGRGAHDGKRRIQACKTPGYSLTVADATVGGSSVDEGMSILLPEFQHEHHRVWSFEEEYLRFLEEGGVEHDERYVFEQNA